MRLSVVIPFYRAAEFVPVAMQNLRRQGAADTEFLLVDDGSEDGTLDALHHWSADVPGARVIARQRNGGLAAARNTGIEAAHGRYLTFLDADDWYGPGYLAQLVDSIGRLACDFIRVDHVQVRQRKRWVVRSPEGRRDEVFAPRDSILPSSRSSGVDYPYAWAGVVDLARTGKDIVRFDDGLHTCEDRPWIWRLYLHAGSHAVVGLHGLFYRRDVGTSLTRIGDARQLHFFEAFDRVLDAVDNAREPDEQFRHKALRSYAAIIAHQLRTSQRFAPELRKTLFARAAATLHALDPGEREAVFTAMADGRVTILRRVMRRYRP